jgi:hypothetical protein
VGLVRKFSDITGVNPRVVVYLVSLGITGAMIYMSDGAVPSSDGNGIAPISAWLTWATVNAELARRVYELLVKRGKSG